jgi:hypothetical protein
MLYTPTAWKQLKGNTKLKPTMYTAGWIQLLWMIEDAYSILQKYKYDDRYLGRNS